MINKFPKHLLKLSKAELEDICVDCGLCCYASAPLGKGSILIPELRCKHLRFDDADKSCCDVYKNRHDVADWCLPLASAIAKGIFPKECPYVKDAEDYVGSAVLSGPAYEMVKPVLQKHLVPQGQPEWVTDEDWEKFTEEVKKGAYRGKGRREGTPGNYKYFYDDESENTPRKPKKSDRVDVWGSISLDHVKQWRSDMRKMTKYYKALLTEVDGLLYDATYGRLDEQKQATFEKLHEDGRRTFRTFVNNLENWGREHLGNKERQKDSWAWDELSKAFWQLDENYEMFPEAYDYNIGTHRPSATRMHNDGEKALRRMQRKVRNALNVAERYIGDQAAENLERGVEYTTTNKHGINFRVYEPRAKDHDPAFWEPRLRAMFEGFDRVHDRFKELGIERSLQDLTVHVHQDSVEDLPLDITTGVPRDSMVAGFYRREGDELRILPFGHDKSNETLIHEIGHRIHWKFMSTDSLAVWEKAVADNQIEVKREHIDQFVDKFLTSEYSLGLPGSSLLDVDKIREATKTYDGPNKHAYQYLAHFGPRRGTADDIRTRLHEWFKEGTFVDKEHVSDYAATNPKEYFAEAFMKYVTKGPGAVPEWTRKQLREAMRSAGMELKKSQDLLDLRKLLRSL